MPNAEDERERKSANLAELVRRMREEMPAQMEFEALKAKLTWIKYKALLEQGFTESQAIELCK